jgi:hypothetical protein
MPRDPVWFKWSIDGSTDPAGIWSAVGRSLVWQVGSFFAVYVDLRKPGRWTWYTIDTKPISFAFVENAELRFHQCMN